MSDTTILKTNMREAFEAIVAPPTFTPLLKRVSKSLRGNAGLMHRKQMWFVKRNNK